MDIKEGQEFFIGGQRYVVKDGAPVQEARRGQLGGKIVSAGGVAQSSSDSFVKVRIAAINSEDNTCKFYLGNSKFKLDMPLDDFNLMGVETNVPQPQQGRVMTAGEAARLPDIVGKRVLLTIDGVDETSDYCLGVSSDGGSDWLHFTDKIEVLY